MDEVVISVDTSLFEQTLMMAVISKSSDFNLIFNLTANKGLTRTTIFYCQTWRWSHGKIIHSCNIRLRDYNIPDTGNVWKLFILRIKNVTLQKIYQFLSIFLSISVNMQWNSTVWEHSIHRICFLKFLPKNVVWSWLSHFLVTVCPKCCLQVDK